MPPKEPRQTNPIIPSRSYLRLSSDDARQKSNDAAADIIREKIDTIYEQAAAADAEPAAPATTVSPTVSDDSTDDEDPYNKTHEDDRTEIQDDQWKQYHSAWQDYYQQYYQRYYLGEVYRMQQGQPAANADPADQAAQEELASGETYHDLRSGLLNNVRVSAYRVRKSRHFMPMIAAVSAALIFIFVSFNQILIGNVEAYVSPGSIDPANIIVDPNVSVPVSADPKLIIPKINVDVPIIWDATPDQTSQLAAMQKGVAWFNIPGASSRPGQIGNTVLSGHSSNDLFDPGDYKFIFARLDLVVPGDTFYINYNSVRYTYSVTKKEVVAPTDVQALIYPTDKPIITLITCTPVGTARSRLLVTAEQVSPSPSSAAAAPATSTNGGSGAAMPGNSPTLLNRLFGG